MHAPTDFRPRPATRYRGTDIDGPTLAPEGLWVRGNNLNDLIGAVSFEHALWQLWFGCPPAAEEIDAVRVRLAAFGADFARGNACVGATAAVAGAGVDMVFAAAAGLMRDVGPLAVEVRRTDWDDDFDDLLACLAGAPHLMCAALATRPAADAGASHARRLLDAAGATRRDPVAERVMDALLVAWHAGFGYITPTVLVPRCAIGTGVTLAQAIAAGFMSSGPLHVGAARAAMHWLQATAGDEVPDAHTDPARVRAAVDSALDEPGTLLSGFGHPLFEQDPRPPHLRALLQELGAGGRYLSMYDVACARAAERKGLHPNIDFITAAALLDLGIREPRWGVAVGLCARIAAMGAHAVERRRRPAFGVNGATARKWLAAVPVGWL